MKKITGIFASALLIGTLLTGCSSGNDEKNNNPSSSNHSSIKQNNNSNSNSNNNNNNNSNSNNNSSNNNNNSQGSGNTSGKQPSGDQMWDSAGGFGYNELEQALRNVGAITEAGTSFQTDNPNIESAKRYGNVAIVYFNYEKAADEAYSYFEKGSMTLNGETVNVEGMIGTYVLLSFDGKLPQEAVKAFHAVGGL